MAKKVFKRIMPSPHKLQNNRSLKMLGKWATDPNLWFLNRSCVATAVSIGLFVGYIPLPGHMIVAAILAILFRANLAIAIVSCWVVNPLTMIPMFGFAYAIGASLLGYSFQDLDFHSWQVLLDVWQPLTLGCLICGTFLAIIGNLLVRTYWRYTVAKSWEERQVRRSITTNAIELAD
ncbi:DUF2062 domain-containing protein [Candidatus Berkiella aquae]|uniref:DUF2062 domain-containing protein n=1 Tax=Candidatus Berkiella aquae TaxID=295108 RepID=A0A0Q9YZ46_9GAMM|nr:DUF2062 domain-containing protein [Candidatus Berkiella aquae]MCS5711798.1 DUF2062 domain-containing protein [Candidatus Berkiella aquae]